AAGAAPAHTGLFPAHDCAHVGAPARAARLACGRRTGWQGTGMMNTALQSLSCDLGRRWLAWRAGKGPEALGRARSAVQQDIPVLLVSYNNGVYVQHMTQQLRALGLCPVVLDNASTDGQTKDVLVRLSRSGDAQVVRLGYNFGHKVAFLPPFYDILPDVFSCSDPDLLLNEDMPQDFLRQLHEVAQRYRVFKAGL